MIFDHAGIVVSDLDRSVGFYGAALKPLGIRMLENNEAGDARWVVFGTGDADPFFVVSNGASYRDDSRGVSGPMHVGFAAPDESSVDAFYANAMAAGGLDNGAPGDRGRGYYGAYVLDPDGNNVEAGFRS